MMAVSWVFVVCRRMGVDWGVKVFIWLNLSRNIKGDWVAWTCDCLEGLGGSGLHDDLLQLGAGSFPRGWLLTVVDDAWGWLHLLMVWLLCHQSWRYRDIEDASVRYSICLGLTFVAIRGSWGDFACWIQITEFDLVSRTFIWIVWSKVSILINSQYPQGGCFTNGRHLFKTDTIHQFHYTISQVRNHRYKGRHQAKNSNKISL